MTDRQDDPKSARDLLPWLVNGTLDENARERVESFLRDSPAGRAETEWLRRLKRHLAEAMEIPEGDLGHGRLMARIAADREEDGKVIELPRRSQRPRWMMPAFALAASVLLAQAVVIGVLLSERGSLQTLSGAPAVTGDVLQVTFRSEAKESDIRALLTAVEGQIVSGPGALGVYTIRVAAGRAERAAKTFGERTDLIESVSVMQR